MLGHICANIDISELEEMAELARLKRLPEDVRQRIFELITEHFDESVCCVDISTGWTGDLICRFEIVGELKSLISTFRARNLDLF